MNSNRALILGIITLSAIIMAMVSPVSAALINGTFYENNVTPQNDIYETVVHPGDTIVLGRTYDLTYVSGVSKAYAWWKDWKIEGSTCTPDLIIETDYIKTNGKMNQKSVFIDPKTWKTGDYFQWDGCYEQHYQKGQVEPTYSVYMRDNNRMFTVIYDPHPPTPKPRITVPVTLYKTPEPVITVTLVQLTMAPVKQKDHGWPWYYWVGAVVIVGLVLRVIW